MFGAHRGAVEGEEPAAFEDAVDDGEREVIVVQHAAPVAMGLFVVKIIARRRLWRLFTTWKSTFAASVP